MDRSDLNLRRINSLEHELKYIKTQFNELLEATEAANKILSELADMIRDNCLSVTPLLDGEIQLVQGRCETVITKLTAASGETR